MFEKLVDLHGGFFIKYALCRILGSYFGDMAISGHFWVKTCDFESFFGQNMIF